MTASKAVIDALRHVKPAVRALSAYTLAAREAAVKLNQNENPYDLPASVKQRVIEAAQGRAWARYPDFDPKPLRERLAAFAGWRADGVIAGNGSNELIEALLLATVGAGTPVVIPEPTFTLYALLTRVLGGEVLSVPLRKNLTYDAKAIAELRRSAAAPLTIVCSPNNPTGGTLESAAIARMCDEADGLVVIDEAYHEFAQASVVPGLAHHPNLVVLRTFSKAMAMAGLRVGYLLAAPELVREIDKARLPYNLNFLSEAAALAALDDWDALRARVQELIASRQRLHEELARIPGVKPYPSQANFILFELDRADPKAIFESLHARGVLVRDVSAYPMLSHCLRVSVGSEPENEAFLAALRTAVEQSRFRPGSKR